MATNPDRGLLDAAMSATRDVTPTTVSGQVATVTAPAPATANQWEVGADQTVAGQLDSILAKGSPLMDAARTRASQTANQRGLLNSSMAVGAGEAAAYDVALPIAQQDASTHAQAGQFNTGERNKLQSQQLDQQMQAGLANQDARNTAAARDQAANLEAQRANQAATGALVEQTQGARLQEGAMQLEQSLRERQTQLEASIRERQMGLDQAFQREMQAADSQTKILLQQMDADTRTNLANIEANYKTLMQSSASAQELYQQSLKNMTDILMNKDLDYNGKQAALNNQYALLRDGMNVLGSINNLNLRDLLNPGSIPGASGTPINAPTPPPAPAPQQPDYNAWAPNPNNPNGLLYSGNYGSGDAS